MPPMRLCAVCWQEVYARSVSGSFHGFPKMVSWTGWIGFVARLANTAGSAETGFRRGTASGRKTIMKTMTMTRRSLLGVSSAAWASSILGRPASAAAEFDFKLGVNTPETHPLTIRLTEAAKAIGAQSSGRLNVTVFPNSQLGGDPEMLSQVRSGGIELLAVPSLTLSILVPTSGLPSIGFAFQSYDQVWAAMDGGVGEVVRDAIGKAGIIPMKKVWDNGFRQITSSSSRQLNSVDDLK